MFTDFGLQIVEHMSHQPWWLISYINTKKSYHLSTVKLLLN